MVKKTLFFVFAVFQIYLEYDTKWKAIGIIMVLKKTSNLTSTSTKIMLRNLAICGGIEMWINSECYYQITKMEQLQTKKH